MSIQQLKRWFKTHKKELAIGAGAAGATAFVFVKFGHRTLPKNPYIHLDFQAGLDTSFDLKDSQKAIAGHMRLNGKNFTLEDLGEVGKSVQEILPNLKSKTPLGGITMNYNIPV